jgi:hypothetical protein
VRSSQVSAPRRLAIRGLPATRPRLPIIAFLGPTWVTAFLKRLREFGWIEGRTTAIEFRWADAHIERYAEVAAEFPGPQVGVISTPASALTAHDQISLTRSLANELKQNRAATTCPPPF